MAGYFGRTPARPSRRFFVPTDTSPTAQIHLIVGPVGAGKSTYGTALAHRISGVRLTLDEWMTRLFRPDRPETDVMPWYVDRAARCVDQIWSVTRALCAVATPVVLEVGMIRRADREGLYTRVDALGAPFKMHVVDAGRDVRRERVARRNAERGETFSMVVPMPFFEFASDLWEPVVEDECVGRDVRFVQTD